MGLNRGLGDTVFTITPLSLGGGFAPFRLLGVYYTRDVDGRAANLYNDRFSFHVDVRPCPLAHTRMGRMSSSLHHRTAGVGHLQ